MDFHSAHPHFKLDPLSASVITAWENSQRVPHPPVHHPSLNYNSFPISPLSPSSASHSTPSSLSVPSANPWTPASLSDFEMLQLRRGIISAAGAVAEREPSLPTGPTLAAANHRPFEFDFDFSLPHFNLPLQRPPSSLNVHQQQQRQHQQQRCSPPLPTPTTPTSSFTLFSSPPVSPESNMSFRRQSPSSSSTSSSSLKRSPSEDGSSKTTTGTKKARACMSVKDFVPPDVSGLSKREARLVKNRAAAFLSRQRKREEFELMEIHVQELERENERLRELAGGSSVSSDSDTPELEILRMQLAASRQREAELSRRLESLQQEQQIKTEMNDPVLSDGSSSGANSPYMGPGLPFRSIVTNPKGGASLGLMVLLCALPSLLSQPSSHPRSTLPTSQSFLDTIQWNAPSVFPTAASASDDVPSWELDFPGSSSSDVNAGNMAMDVDYGNVRNREEERDWQKLELGLENDNLGGLGLGALDVSFATRRTKDGKIRVRVHSSPSTSTSTSTSASASEGQPKTEDFSSSANDGVADSALMGFSLPSPAQSHSSSPSESGMNPPSLSIVDTDPLGPFLGAGSSPTGAFELGAPFDFSNFNPNPNLFSGIPGVGNAQETATQSGERLRVRIALRSLPQTGGEGGEWEVEVR